MTTSIVFYVSIIATAANGILTGASLDQSIKQLPARHKIGVIAFSQYSQAADLSNGILWYAILGIGAACVTIADAVVAFAAKIPLSHGLPISIAAFFSLLHSLVTMQAAPINFNQRNVATDEKALAKVLNQFESGKQFVLFFKFVRLQPLFGYSFPIADLFTFSFLRYASAPLNVRAVCLAQRLTYPCLKLLTYLNLSCRRMWLMRRFDSN